MKCLFCGGELINPEDSKLDQCANTYLPAKEYACANEKCYATTTLATGENYRPYEHVKQLCASSSNG